MENPPNQNNENPQQNQGPSAFRNPRDKLRFDLINIFGESVFLPNLLMIL